MTTPTLDKDLRHLEAAAADLPDPDQTAAARDRAVALRDAAASALADLEARAALGKKFGGASEREVRAARDRHEEAQSALAEADRAHAHATRVRESFAAKRGDLEREVLAKAAPDLVTRARELMAEMDRHVLALERLQSEKADPLAADIERFFGRESAGARTTFTGWSALSPAWPPSAGPAVGGLRFWRRLKQQHYLTAWRNLLRQCGVTK